MTEPSAVADSSAESLVAQVTDEFLERHSRGEQPDIEEYAIRYPALADVLRPTLAALRLIACSPAPLDAYGEPLSLGSLGDFRLIREVGRGGMGIVYEAEQISLGRRVALKVLPFAATMDQRQLQRFQNEARAAASLEHPHIVPVYGVGCERGVHYYAMKYIDGQSMAEVTAELRIAKEAHHRGTEITEKNQKTAVSSSLCSLCLSGSNDFYKAVAELGIQAAEALEHAHSLGIVHRDIKPANLMIDGHGQLWITDFGLARTAADAGLTMTGDVLGTLRYMSPEQALAKHGLVDHRTDVYSLGVTLYELLTGTPAVEGKDREEILNAITRDEPRPPREFESALPQDLETIVLKALAKEPPERYPSARELADDLRRYLDARPILARRPTFLQRVVKWGRRHRALVWMGVAALALTAVASMAGAVIVWHEKEQTQVALKRVEAQRQRAETNFSKALKGMIQLLEASDTIESLDEQQQVAVRRALTDSMEKFIEGMQDEASTDPVDRRETGWAYQHLGVFFYQRGDYTRAERELYKALAIHEGLASEYPAEPDVLWMYSQSLDRLGTLLFAEGQMPEGRIFLRRALENYRRGVDLGVSESAQHRLAHFLVSCIDSDIRDPVEGVRLATQLVRRNPDRADYWQTLGRAHFRNDNLHAAQHDFEECTRLDGRGSAATYFFLAMIHWKLGAKDRAETYYDRAAHIGAHRIRGPQSFFRKSLQAEASALLGINEPESPKVKEESPAKD